MSLLAEVLDLSGDAVMGGLILLTLGLMLKKLDKVKPFPHWFTNADHFYRIEREWKRMTRQVLLNMAVTMGAMVVVAAVVVAVGWVSR